MSTRNFGKKRGRTENEENDQEFRTNFGRFTRTGKREKIL